MTAASAYRHHPAAAAGIGAAAAAAGIGAVGARCVRSAVWRHGAPRTSKVLDKNLHGASNVPTATR